MLSRRDGQDTGFGHAPPSGTPLRLSLALAGGQLSTAPEFAATGAYSTGRKGAQSTNVLRNIAPTHNKT